jgi:signal transduction histidine kinase
MDSTPFDLLTHPDVTALAAWFAPPVLFLRALSLPLSLSLLLTFPDGRFSPRWTRWLLLGYSLLTLVYLLFPDFPTNTIYGATYRRTLELSFAVGMTPFFIGIYAQIRRYRAASLETRNQLKWTVLGMVMMISGVILYFGTYVLADNLIAQETSFSITVLETIRQFIQLVISVVLPIICLMIAIFRYRLWSADPVINRVLVYTAFVGSLSLIYFVSLLLVGLLVNTINFVVSIPVTLFMLVIFSPLRDRIQRTVDQLMFGERGNPGMVLSQLNAQIDINETSERALTTVAEMLVQTLKIPCVMIAMTLNEQERVVTATYGEPSGRFRLLRFPMAFGGQAVGEISLYQDAGDRPFNTTERELVETVARQTALAVHTMQLNSALHKSCQTIVSAREEERRRLRRDLHDGLGPTLAAHTLKIGKARALVMEQPQIASAIMSDLERDLAASLGEIRRMVEALRPAALDQLGLASALRQFMYDFTDMTSADNATRFQLHMPEALPPLPAAVEVAVYRIVTEAVTNVMRHARAAHASVSITVHDALDIAICDDGIGLPQTIHYGIGLRSMRERAEEVGGSLELLAAVPTGTIINARLPIT